MTDYTPVKADKFAFGLWTVGWQGVDPFGGATRDPLDVGEALHKLSDMGAWGLTFHDDDLIPFGTDVPERERIISRFRSLLDETGMVVPMVTTNLFSHPVFKEGGLTANDRQVRRFSLAKVRRNIDLAASLGAKTYVVWGGREGSESDVAKDVPSALNRYAEGLNTLCEYVTEQGYDIKFALEPKPNEPRGDILLPTIGHAIAFIDRLAYPDMVGVNPEVGHEEMASMNFTQGIAQALWSGKLFHIDLNGQKGPRFDQDLRFGSGNIKGAFSLVDLLEHGTLDGGPGYDGPKHFDFKAPRTEGPEGVWDSAAGCMRNYLIFRERARNFRADPRVQEALLEAKVAELAVPTLAPGETLDTLRDESYDPDALGKREVYIERLDQLFMDHLLGAV
ncbi:xylose isomerase [Nakamurella silvestris]|nr:xylose isomerase [Nakamurella silvestris]